jgi:hypothetical protein
MMVAASAVHRMALPARNDRAGWHVTGRPAGQGVCNDSLGDQVASRLCPVAVAGGCAAVRPDLIWTSACPFGS